MPAIIVATPGRLWELMDEHMEPFLLNGLPMIDTLVLDEADRMIADGHFKELTFILNHIYNKRVAFKKEALQSKKTGGGKVGITVSKDDIATLRHEGIVVDNDNEPAQENFYFLVRHACALDTKLRSSRFPTLE